MYKLTVAKLKKLQACEDQLKVFEELYPEGVEITEAACLAVAGRFDWDWVAGNLLPEALKDEYRRIGASAWAEYQRINEPAWDECRRIGASARAEYERARAAAWAEYERARAAAWAEYERIEASTFGRLMEGK